MNPKNLKIIAGILFALVAIRVVTLIRRPNTAPEFTKDYQALGARAAHLIARELTGSENGVLILTQQTDTKLVRQRLDAFKASARQNNLQIREILYAEESDHSPERGVSQRLFAQVENHLSDVDAVVSFIGMPPPNVFRQSARAQNTDFYLILPGDPFLRDYLEADIVKFAIMPKGQVGNLYLNPKVSDDEWFENFYEVVTKDRAQMLPGEESLSEIPDDDIVDDFYQLQ
ncbi:MAG: hypothetical protein JJU29_17565 [Verrucomicrobia bacterium]|nr:hypothetical protein [Verrucomicrobiota bacterium]MCH8513750.1 hypothetical protein [Kiritimatiellia bacterium]